MSEINAEEVRRQWSYSKDPGPGRRTTEEWWQIRDEACEEFDQWLASVEAAAEQRGKEQGWDEGYEASDHEAYYCSTHGNTENPYRTIHLEDDDD